MNDIAEELGEISAQLHALSERTSDLGTRVTSEPPEHNDLPPGQRLIRARNRAKMTQKGLADVSGVSANTIINFENGHNQPRVQTLMKLAEALNIPWEYLRGESNDDE